MYASTLGQRHRTVLRSVSCVIVTATLVAGCSLLRHDTPAHRGGTLGQTTVVPARAGTTAAAPLPAPDLALRLEALLGAHSVLVADMMRGRIRGDDDFAQAANSALGRNTDAMVGLVSANFGAPAAQRFGALWSAHVAALSRYAGGLADNSDAERADARATLVTFESDLGAFFAAASQGRLSKDLAQAAVLMHVDHLLKQADSYAAHDYATADQIFREGYEHTYDLGRTLAGALVPPAQATVLDAASWRLRSELGRLLAEHVVLVIDATRAGVTNAPDFSAAAKAVNGNTADLAAAVDTLFGGKAAAGFQSLWADHIDQIVAYAAATVAHDTAGRDAAVARLHTFETRMAAFLDTATGHRLESATLAKALVMHDQMLLQQTDAFAGKRYQQAHDIADTTYDHMIDLAGQLANAFGETAAARLPSGGPKTGQGGMAAVVGRR